MQGGINPSSMTVIDDDFETSMAGVGWNTFDCAVSDGVDDARPTGRGVMVAVLDAGFNLDHPLIAANISPLGYDAIDLDDDPSDTGNGIDDDFERDDDDRERDDDACEEDADTAAGHGTFVAGMVLSVAPEATIVPIRVRDDEGWGTNEELIRGIDYAVAIGVDVINLSLDGAQAKKLDVRRTLRRVRNAGILVVLAAGNDGAKIRETSMHRHSIVVGATDPNGWVAPFSNYTTSSDFGLIFLYTLGMDLIGPMGAEGDDASMGIGSGTSFSAGIVSGALAAYREWHPHATVEEAVEALRRCSAPVWHAELGCLPGGRLDVERMVRQ